MSYHPADTVAAIATAPGGAARSMVRVSGPDVPRIVERCFVGDAGAEFSSQRSAQSASGELKIHLHDAARRVPCTLFYWPDRRSYTREPVAEFHTVGSPPLTHALLEAICNAGARLAEPGEFTLRAFLAGRLDLTQAEAVLGVIDAHDERDLRGALEQLAGNLARPLGRLREELLMLLAELEAGLDFVEEDIEFISADELVQRLGGISVSLQEIARTMAARCTSKDAAQVALVGAPNAGKSSLFNALVNRFGSTSQETSPAIVSEIRGTTRDYLVATVELTGVRCELVDTAGVDSRDVDVAALEAIARDRANNRRERALLRVMCIDAASADCGRLLSEAAQTAEDLIVLTKADAAPDASVSQGLSRHILTSSISGVGLEGFAVAVAQRLVSTTASERARCVAQTADRCRESVRQAEAAVARAVELARGNAGEELVAVEIRSALAELGKVVGVVYTDDLLDRIFKAFCIGK